VSGAHARHARLIESALERLRSDDDVIGVLLQGSVARGDAHPGSDLDLFVLLRPGASRPFAAETVDGILVETHFADAAGTRERMERAPRLAYGFLRGRVLSDPEGEVDRLINHAAAVLAAYRPRDDKVRGVAHWLRSARVKIAAALDAGDARRAAFVAGTTTWKILEGLWAVNVRPVPPSGAVFAEMPALGRVPVDWNLIFDRLLLADAEARGRAAIEVIDWILPRLPVSPSG
jgi:predicted nucleotidyltransferase